MLRRVCDGFTLRQDIKSGLVFYQPSHALAQMDAFRRSRSYSNRLIVAPSEDLMTVPARGEIEYQAKVKPGSWWWGWSMVGEVAGFAQSGFRLDIKITDEANGAPIFSDMIDGNLLEPIPGASYLTVLTPGGPMLLEQPYPVVAPGLLNFEVHNNSDTDTVFQFVLSVMEPCTRSLQVQECVAE